MKFKDKDITISKQNREYAASIIIEQIKSAWYNNIVSDISGEELFDEYNLYNTDKLEYSPTIYKVCEEKHILINVVRNEGHGTYMKENDFSNMVKDFLNTEDNGNLFDVACLIIGGDSSIFESCYENFIEVIVSRLKTKLFYSFDQVKSIPLPKLPIPTRG